MSILKFDNPVRLFYQALAATFLLRLLLAALLPLSGDEAYFVLWARHPDFGYYDHPPMVGWFLYLVLQVGQAEWLLRLPAILTTILISLGMFQLLKPRNTEKAALVASLFLLAPVNVLNVLITTDTPLLLFAFLSMAALFHALKQDKWSYYLWSGIFFGLAFLSKYFAVLLGLSYLIFWLLSPKQARRTWGFVILFAASFPFALVNLYWNYTHCWDNVLFNLYTRNEGAHFSVTTIIEYLGLLLYLATPPLIWLFYKYRTGLLQRIKQHDQRLFMYVLAVPLLAFALLALKKAIGLHWVLAFYPALFLLLFPLLESEQLKKLLRFMLAFTALHVVLLLILAALPLQTWKQSRLYGGIVMLFEHDKVVEQLRPYDESYLLATDGYSPSATLEYYYGKPFFVFGEGGLHARQDDMLTDLSNFNLNDILIFSKSAPDMQAYTPYFASVSVRTFTLHGATFHLVLGKQFNFEKYRNEVLRTIKDKYYRIPSWLPHAPCYFCEKYFINQCDTPVN